MTKKEIVEELFNTLGKELHISRGHLQEITDSVFDSFTDILAASGRIEIRDFGVFNIKRTPERIGRNPLTKEEAIVPARNIIQFKAGKKMKNAVGNS